MLVVGRQILTLPMLASVTVRRLKTVLLLASNDASKFPVGEIGPSGPENSPRLIGFAGRQGVILAIDDHQTANRCSRNSCEANTRWSLPRRLTFWSGLYPPQETRTRLAAQTNHQRRARLLFKRQAPNNMKKEDLVAKSWIITDPCSAPTQFDPVVLQTDSDFPACPIRMRKTRPILYPQKSYGGRFSYPGSSSPRCFATAPWARCFMPRASLSTVRTTN